mgnify:CR=1 FL=1
MLKSSLAIFALLLSLQSASAADIQEQKFGDWEYRCDDQNCELRQIVRNAKEVPVVQVTLYRGDNQTTQVRVAVPLNVNLRRAAVLAEGEQQQSLAYLLCSSAGCMAGGQLSAEMIAAFRAGSEASLNFTSVTAGPLRAPISLKGFTAGHRKLLSQ